LPTAAPGAQRLVGVPGDVVYAAFGAVPLGDASSCPPAFVACQAAPYALTFSVEGRPRPALSDDRTFATDRLGLVHVLAPGWKPDVRVAAPAGCLLLPVDVP